MPFNSFIFLLFVLFLFFEEEAGERDFALRDFDYLRVDENLCSFLSQDFYLQCS
jgi:hypothetical protein